MTEPIERKTCRAPDGVTLAYSAAGAGEPALLFIPGGLAERGFYDRQLAAFAPRHRVIAVDLPGHGESGADRAMWGIPAYGADVRAVADAEGLRQVVLFGNSLGGPVAVEAALLLAGRCIGVVGIDTFHRLNYTVSDEEARQRAEMFRADLPGSVKAMLKALFHADADPAVVAEAERLMGKTPPDAAHALFLALAGYDGSVPARRLTVPLRAINGDLHPIDFPSVRAIAPGFSAVVLEHTGHYPMIERPDEFNRHVENVVRELARLAGEKR